VTSSSCEGTHVGGDADAERVGSQQMRGCPLVGLDKHVVGNVFLGGRLGGGVEGGWYFVCQRSSLAEKRRAASVPPKPQPTTSTNKPNPPRTNDQQAAHPDVEAAAAVHLFVGVVQKQLAAGGDDLLPDPNFFAGSAAGRAARDAAAHEGGLLGLTGAGGGQQPAEPRGRAGLVLFNQGRGADAAVLRDKGGPRCPVGDAVGLLDVRGDASLLDGCAAAGDWVAVAGLLGGRR